jgi:uncharacterized phiE125 gp8 family phage protein
MRLVLVTPPTVEPLTGAEVKVRLNIGPEMTDETADSLIKAAREMIDGRDGWLGRALVTQTWQGTLDGFPCREIRLPLPPLQGVNAVQYLDDNGSPQELDSSDYQIMQGARPYIVPAFGKSWPSTRCGPDAVSIEFVAGYGDNPEDVPEPIRSAIALQVSSLRSLTARNLFLSQDTVDGVGSKQYIVGGNAGAAIDAAVASLLSTYRVFA